MECSTMMSGSLVPMLEPVSLTCTIAVTTKQNIEFNKLASVSLCLHVDTSPVSVGLSRPQVFMSNIFEYN